MLKVSLIGDCIYSFIMRKISFQFNECYLFLFTNILELLFLIILELLKQIVLQVGVTTPSLLATLLTKNVGTMALSIHRASSALISEFCTCK